MNKEYPIKNEFLETVENTIKRYALLEEDKRVVVAFSGGKDSTVTALALRELGYEVTPAVVCGIWDRYNVGRVQKIAKDIRFDNLQVLDVRTLDYQIKLREETRRRVNKTLGELKDLGKKIEETGLMGNVSPCTMCYNNKATALEVLAGDLEVDRIAFGHHQDDALSSFLKSGLMYQDYTTNENKPYDTSRFTGLVEKITSDLDTEVGSGNLVHLLEDLTSKKVVGTDEPPRQLVTPNSSIQIVRPLYASSEKDIKEIRDSSKIEVEGSGCAHGLEMTRTAREIIHQDLIPRLSDSQRTKLVDLIEKSLNPDGSLSFNARRERDKLMPGYKEGGCKL